MQTTQQQPCALPSVGSAQLPFRHAGVARLVSASCTYQHAEHLFRCGEVGQRDFKRFVRIWQNVTFRANSRSQDQLFELEGQRAVERRHERATKLHAGWRKKVMLHIAQHCLAKVGK